MKIDTLPKQPDHQPCPECGQTDECFGLDAEYVHCDNCGYEGPSNKLKRKRNVDIQKMLKDIVLAQAIEPGQEETVMGMIGADLSSDQDIINEYILNTQDFDGLQEYIDILIESGEKNE